MLLVHPTCPSHVKQAQTQLKTAQDACETKTNKYMKLAQQQSADFVPFALESYGGISDSANDLINEIYLLANICQHGAKKRLLKILLLLLLVLYNEVMHLLHYLVIKPVHYLHKSTMTVKFSNLYY